MTTISDEGIESEKGIGALLKLPETKHILGKDLVFEFQALLTENSGPNLRHDLSHGLAEYQKLISSYSIYLWWLCLKLILNPIGPEKK